MPSRILCVFGGFRVVSKPDVLGGSAHALSCQACVLVSLQAARPCPRINCTETAGKECWPHGRGPLLRAGSATTLPSVGLSFFLRCVSVLRSERESGGRPDGENLHADPRAKPNDGGARSRGPGAHGLSQTRRPLSPRCPASPRLPDVFPSPVRKLGNAFGFSGSFLFPATHCGRHTPQGFAEQQEGPSVLGSPAACPGAPPAAGPSHRSPPSHGKAGG